MVLLKKIFAEIELNLASIFYAGMLLLILLSVGMRTFGSGLTWSEELARYFVVWGTCLGIAGGVKARRHIRIDMVIDQLPPKISCVVEFIIDVISVLIFAFIFYFGCSFVSLSFNSGQIAPALRQPMWIVYLAFPLGFGLSVIRQLVNAAQRAKDLKTQLTGEKAVTKE